MNIRITSWNIYGGRLPEEIYKVITSLNSDIYLLQEVPATFDISGRLGYYRFYCQGQTIGNSILSRFPLISPSCAVLTNEIDYDGTPSTEQRMATIASIPVESHMLNIISTHLYFPHDQSSPAGSAEYQQKKLLEHIKKEHMVLGGDFNTEGKNHELKTIEDILVDCGKDDKRPTFHNIKYNMNEKKKLDHMFVSSDLKVVSYDVQETSASDHYPVTVEIILQ